MQHTFRRKLAVRAGAFAVAAVLGLAPAIAQEDEVVANLNGQPITESDLALAQQELDQQFAQMPEAQRRAAALSAVIDVRLLASQAEEEGLDETETFQERMNFLRERALHTAYINENVVGAISEEEVRQRYDEEVAKLSPPEEIRARHILVETEEEAQDIIARLNEGGDFAEIAGEASQDGSAQNGGDLGYFARGSMVPAFEEAAFALEIGNYTEEPVETQFGWHVIKIEDKRTQEAPAFEQVQNQIRALIVRDRYIDAISSLRDTAELEIPNEDLAQTVDQLFKAQMGATPAEAPAADAAQ